MRKRMYKAKKHWVIASAAALTVLGTGAAASADETTPGTVDPSTEVTAATSISSRANTSADEANSSTQATSETTDSSVAVSEQETSEILSEAGSESATNQAPISDSTVSSESESQENTVSVSEAIQESATAEVKPEEAAQVQVPASSKSLVRASVAATVAKDSNAAQETTTATVSGTKLTLRYNKNIADDEIINFAVWSDENDQDDLVWYRADAQAAAYVDLSKHKSYGTYHIHTYSYINGQNIARDGKDIVVAKSNVTSKFEQDSNGNYTITIGNVGADITDIQVPVWSDNKDQDDIIWYRANKKDSSTYTLTVKPADHHNDFGHYQVHIYGQSAITGGMVGLTATKGFDRKATSDAVKEAPRNDVTANLGDKGINLNLSSNTVTDLSRVRFAVWSDVNDQDDLKWYSADSNGNAAALYSDHSGYGTYHIHTYLDQNGQMIGLNGKTITIDRPSIKGKVAKVDDSTYTIKVSNVPNYITAVKVPVWSDKNDQDDIVWYDAAKNADGTYTATVKLKNHNFEAGNYSAHIYGMSSLEAGKMIGLGSSPFTVERTTAPSNATTAVRNHNEAEGTIEVVLSENDNSKKATKLAVAAWSQDNQANIHWYEADVINGSASVKVDEKFHSYIKGNYTIHAYVTYQDNSQSGHDLGQYSLQKEQSGGYFVDISSHNGSISVADYQSLRSQGITGVVVKLTEGTSYINPYAASQIANAKAAGMKISVYHFARYTNADQARAEAAYFVNVAKSYGLTSSTAMVNDMESSDMLNNINANTAAWTDAMRSMGYNNLIYYTMASWLDTRGGSLNTAQLGMENMWIAHYINGYTYLSQDSAKQYGLYSNAAAWQYTSVSRKLAGNLDENIDYTGRLS
ncbi:GBS Bsp-like repeat-containing protein [Streptococcus dentapri]|uniref:Lysozyme n=1 Tax=Streptococcus dentapri TaxID=573564 RepID=A0ABV8CYR8_9STRE